MTALRMMRLPDNIGTNPKTRDALAAFCEQNHIRRFAFFGSVLTEEFDEKSDIDVLVEFEPAHVPGFAFFTMQEELAAILGRKVDLVTPGFLSPWIRPRVEATAMTIYARD